MKQHIERRKYYRINDVVGLTYSIINTDKPPALMSTDNVGMPIKELLAEIDHEFNQATNTLWHENPIIAHALGLLNKKLSIVAAQTLGESDIEIDSYEDFMVNISGSGIAFDCKENLLPGTRLQLTLILKPANIPLQLTGEVATCKEQSVKEAKPYRLSVSFEDNNISAIEKVIQHVVQKQCAQIGEKNPE